jgi:ribulose 1,5-bisphosphate synthetase/thiazole synthase
VLVVGAGPSGLSAACHLTRLDAEVNRILDLGVMLKLNAKITGIPS